MTVHSFIFPKNKLQLFIWYSSGHQSLEIQLSLRLTGKFKIESENGPCGSPGNFQTSSFIAGGFLIWQHWAFINVCFSTWATFDFAGAWCSNWIGLFDGNPGFFRRCRRSPRRKQSCWWFLAQRPVRRSYGTTRFSWAGSTPRPRGWTRLTTTQCPCGMSAHRWLPSTSRPATNQCNWTKPNSLSTEVAGK